MSKPDFDKSQVDPGEMFDFLHNGGRQTGGRPANSRRRRSFEMPIIRKPVPVSKSGPVRIESAGSASVSDRDVPDISQSQQRSVSGHGDADWSDQGYFDNVDTRSSSAKKFTSILIALVLLAGAAFAYFMYTKGEQKDNSNKDDNLPGIVQLDTPNDQIPEIATTPADEAGTTEPTEVTDNTLPADAAEPADSIESAEPTEIPEATERPNTLFNRFNEQVQLLERLIAENELDEAERIIFTMDRAVYGYGASEFTGFEQQIAKQRAAISGQTDGTGVIAESNLTENAESETSVLAEPISEEQALLEAQRLAEEQRLAEAKRILDEEQAAEQQQIADDTRAAEAARQAEELRLAEEARVAEELRLLEEAQAAEVARQAEELRIAEANRAAELAQQAELEAQRVAEEERLASAERLAVAEQAEQARLEKEASEAEQARLAEQERLAAEQAAANLAEQQAQVAAESLALATEKAADRIVEERARLNRETDAELARQEAQVQESERIRSEEALVNQPAEPQPSQQVATSISDDDFNFVAGKFVELKTAVANKDIDTVIALTKPSGKRIQQMLQIFENSESVQARVSNVATRNADGVIVGQLNIQKVIKKSGAVATVPSSLSSITLTSKRGPEGWSAIAW